MFLGYRKGIGVEPDVPEAVRWYRSAALKGSTTAQCNLGNCYLSATGVQYDPVEAIKWYRMAGPGGIKCVQFALGVMYDSGFTGIGNGNGIGKCISKDTRGTYSPRGRKGLVPADPAEAVKWYQLAASSGSRDAQFNLAMCYEHGSGVKADTAHARHWYHLAAADNDPQAQLQLALCYTKSDELEDGEAAFQWFKCSADQGNADAQFQLAVRYDNGAPGTEVADPAEALRYYLMAAKQGHINAQFNAGSAYAYGTGVEKDSFASNQWFYRAAQQEDPEAQFILAYNYEHGIGTSTSTSTNSGSKGPISIRRAVKWYSRAADNGYAAAQCNLGNCYLNGQGVVRNVGCAQRLYRLAAEQGDEQAKSNLDICYQIRSQEDATDADTGTPQLYYTPPDTPTCMTALATTVESPTKF